MQRKCRSIHQFVAFPLRAELADISASGLYAKAFSPFQKGTPVNIRVRVEGYAFEAQAEVATGDPGVGMGFRFVQSSEESLCALRALLQRLRESEQEALSSTPTSGSSESFRYA